VAESAGLQAGAFAIDVTPLKFPVSVNGGFSDRQATKANDPMHARCIVLTQGATSLVLVTIDSCMLPRSVHDQTKALAEKATGIPAKNMLISATHTHTAPTAVAVFQSKPDPEYVKFLTEKIAEGITTAAKNRVPAEAGWAKVEEPSQVFNRRWKMKPGTINTDPFGGTTDLVKMNPGIQNPNLLEQAGGTDPEVSVLAIRTRTGKPIALHANYSLHYVGDMPPLSADYFGVFCEKIGPMIGAEATQSPPFMAALSNGTSGDVNNVDFSQPALKTMPGERCRKVAEVVATAAKKAYENIRFSSDFSLAAAEEEIELGARKPTEKEVIRAKEIIDQAAGKPLTKPDQVYANETLIMAEFPATVKLKLQTMRVGDLGITAIPCEVFTEIGLKLKKDSPMKSTFNISLANGYNGYLPTPAQHRLGGYETWRAQSSYLEVEASDKIVPVVLKLLAKVKAE
jgi:hypothetical protein